MNRTEIILAAIGIISIVSLAGVTVAYTNLLATQQQEMNLLLFAYFGIPPTPYGITFIVTNATDPNNTTTITKRLTWSDLLRLENTTFPSGATGALEIGPSLNNITYYFFGLNLTSLNLTNPNALDIVVLGAAGGTTGLGHLVYKVPPWDLGEISSEYPILDYAEGGGGGTATYHGTCKFCAPTGYGGYPDYFAKTYYVKAVNTVGITFNATM
nr:hypothetical protein [Candidatus Freyarchaeota archaeon]